MCSPGGFTKKIFVASLFSFSFFCFVTIILVVVATTLTFIWRFYLWVRPRYYHSDLYKLIKIPLILGGCVATSRGEQKETAKGALQ